MSTHHLVHTINKAFETPLRGRKAPVLSAKEARHLVSVATEGEATLHEMLLLAAVYLGHDHEALVSAAGSEAALPPALHDLTLPRTPHLDAGARRVLEALFAQEHLPVGPNRLALLDEMTEQVDRGLGEAVSEPEHDGWPRLLLGADPGPGSHREGYVDRTNGMFYVKVSELASAGGGAWTPSAQARWYGPFRIDGMPDNLPGTEPPQLAAVHALWGTFAEQLERRAADLGVVHTPNARQVPHTVRLDLAAVDMGYLPVGHAWRRIDPERGQYLLGCALARDLNTSSPVLPDDSAQALAEAFFAAASDKEVQVFVSADWDGRGHPSNDASLSSHRHDLGVGIVGRETAALAVISDDG